jgi:hypothetical protein
MVDKKRGGSKLGAPGQKNTLSKQASVANDKGNKVMFRINQAHLLPLPRHYDMKHSRSTRYQCNEKRDSEMRQTNFVQFQT